MSNGSNGMYPTVSDICMFGPQLGRLRRCGFSGGSMSLRVGCYKAEGLASYAHFLSPHPVCISRCEFSAAPAAMPGNRDRCSVLGTTARSKPPFSQLPGSWCVITAAGNQGTSWQQGAGCWCDRPEQFICRTTAEDFGILDTRKAAERS